MAIEICKATAYRHIPSCVADSAFTVRTGCCPNLSICVLPEVLAVCPCCVCEALLSDYVLIAWCDLSVCEMRTAGRGLRVCPCHVHDLLHCLSVDPSCLTDHAVCLAANWAYLGVGPELGIGHSPRCAVHPAFNGIAHAAACLQDFTKAAVSYLCSLQEREL